MATRDARWHQLHHEGLAKMQADIDRRWQRMYEHAKKMRIHATRKYADSAVGSQRVHLVATWRAHLQSAHEVKELGPFVSLADLQKMHDQLHAAEDLTPAQKRILTEVMQSGVRVYNGRARGPIEALEKAGLVTVEWDMIPQSKGNGIELRERITVRAKEQKMTTKITAQDRLNETAEANGWARHDNYCGWPRRVRYDHPSGKFVVVRFSARGSVTYADTSRFHVAPATGKAEWVRERLTFERGWS